MDNEEYWEALNEKAEGLVTEVLNAAGFVGGATVEWFFYGARIDTAAPYCIDRDKKTVGINRSIVEGWLRWPWPEEAPESPEPPSRRVEDRFAALVLRAAAALLFAPPADRWKEACDLHVRSEEEQGLDSSYRTAFRAASAILEGHRLDRLVLDLIPDAGVRLAELARFDLEAHPEFDVYPRAAVIMGRPDLPSNLGQPAFDEFVDRFGINEADELVSLLNTYVSCSPDDIDAMVEQTQKLVFYAFPEAMGLGWFDDEDGPAAAAPWDLKGQIPAGEVIGWDELELFIASSLAQFTGHAGLDFGDVLLIGFEDGIADPRIGMWAGGDYLNFGGVDFGDDLETCCREQVAHLFGGRGEARRGVVGPRNRIPDLATLPLQHVVDDEPAARSQHPERFGIERGLIGDVHRHVHGQRRVRELVRKTGGRGTPWRAVSLAPAGSPSPVTPTPRPAPSWLRPDGGPRRRRAGPGRCRRRR